MTDVIVAAGNLVGTANDTKVANFKLGRAFVLKVLDVSRAQEKLYGSAVRLTSIASLAPLAALVGRHLLMSLTHVGQQAVEKAARREREALIPRLSKLRCIASARLTVVMVEPNAAT